MNKLQAFCFSLHVPLPMNITLSLIETLICYSIKHYSFGKHSQAIGKNQKFLRL